MKDPFKSFPRILIIFEIRTQEGGKAQAGRMNRSSSAILVPPSPTSSKIFSAPVSYATIAFVNQLMASIEGQGRTIIVNSLSYTRCALYSLLIDSNEIYIYIYSN